MKEYTKKWRESNKEKIKEYRRKYTIENKDKINSYTREWRKRKGNRKKKENKKRDDPLYYEKYYEKNKEKIKEQIKRNSKTPKGKERLRLRKERMRKKHPEKTIARNKANREIKIPQGQLCEICHKNLAVHKHHEDYSKPLEVNFLCWSCHRKIHIELKHKIE